LEQGNTLRVLIVEDDPDMASMLKMLLERKFSVTVEIAEDCASAREKFKSKTFDIITLDYQLPDGDGLGLLGEINEMEGLPPVIMVTGHGDEQTAVESFKQGASGYVVKDKRLSTLLPDAVEHALSEMKLRRAEERQEELLLHLGERVKELTCLYGLSAIAGRPGISLEEILKEAVELIPPSWQYPDITCAKLVVGDEEFTTDNYRDTDWTQSADIIVEGERKGTLHVCYLEEMPESCEGPFLAEERKLIDAIAERLGSIIERKRVEEELRMKNIAIESAISAIAIADLEGKLTYVNDAFLRMWGYASEEEVLGKPAIEFHVDEYEAQKIIEEVMGKRTLTAEIASRRKDGSTFTAQVSSTTITDESSNPVLVMASFVDITERKRVEEELRGSEEKYRTLLESSPDSIGFTSMEGQLLDANQAFLDMLGYTMEELGELTYKQLTPEKWHELDEGIVRDLIEKDPYSGVYEKEYIRKDGTAFPIEVRVWLVRDDQGEAAGIWGFVREAVAGFLWTGYSDC